VHLYRGTTEQFIGDAVRATLANQLAERFFEEFRYKPSPGEVTSWHNSLSAMSNALQLADLRDQGILVELKLPLSSKRLDVLVTGSNANTGSDSAVIVELKQWTKAQRSNITDCVTVDFGGRLVDHLHPSKQVQQYQRYLIDTHPAFTDGAVALDACAWLHYAQFDPTSPLFHADFDVLLAQNPSFTGDQLDDFASFLDERVSGLGRATGRLQRDHGRGPRGRAEPAGGRIHRRRRARDRKSAMAESVMAESAARPGSSASARWCRTPRRRSRRARRRRRACRRH
jgi:hypothetical protein